MTGETTGAWLATGPAKHREPGPPRLPRLAAVAAIAAALLLVASQAVSAHGFTGWFHRHHKHTVNAIHRPPHRAPVGGGSGTTAPTPTTHPTAKAGSTPKPTATTHPTTGSSPTAGSTPTTGSAPVPPPPASNGDWPNASNTGVPAGVSLKSSGGMTITKAGTVISGLNVTGTITIAADNVTIKDSKITGRGYSIINVNKGVTGAVIEDDEINGSGMSGSAGSAGVMGTVTVLRCDIYGVENGVTPQSNSKIEDSYIHDLNAPGSPHYDGIQMDGGLHDILVQGNTINNNHGQTSAVMIDDYFGPISDITVNGNLLIGGGYPAYSDGSFGNGSISGVSYVNNVFGKGYYGYALLRDGSVTWSNNTDESTGKQISAH